MCFTGTAVYRLCMICTAKRIRSKSKEQIAEFLIANCGAYVEKKIKVK